MSDKPEFAIDRQQLVYRDWNRKQQKRIASLITDELIEEHRRQPLGQHSETLERVLQFFRRQPQHGKYLGVMTEPWTEYKVGIISAERGVPPRILEAPTFATENDVLHGIFELRVRQLLEATR